MLVYSWTNNFAIVGTRSWHANLAFPRLLQRNDIGIVLAEGVCVSVLHGKGPGDRECIPIVVRFGSDAA